MSRYLLGLHAGCSEPGVHSVLVELGPGANPCLKYKLGMFQPFPLEISRWLSKVGDKSPSETQYFPQACRIITSQFVIAAYSAIRESGLKPNAITALGCDAHLGSLEGSNRMRIFAGWGPGMDIAKGTGISVVSLHSGPWDPRQGAADPVFCTIDGLASHKEVVVHLHLGGGARLAVKAPGKPIRVIPLGPCGALFDVFTSGWNPFAMGVELLSKKAVQGACEDSCLDRWQQLAMKNHFKPGQDVASQGFLQEVTRTLNKEMDPANLLCTAHHWVVKQIEAGIADIPQVAGSARFQLSGPHTRNNFLRHLIALAMPGITWKTMDGDGLPSAAFDAYARAWTAGLSLNTSFMHSGTSHRNELPSAAFFPGNEESWSRCLRWMNNDSSRAA